MRQVLPGETYSVLELQQTVRVIRGRKDKLSELNLNILYEFIRMPRLQQSKIKTSLTLNNVVKQMHFTTEMDYAVLVRPDSIQILDLIIDHVISTIKKLVYPRSVRLAKSGAFFLAQYTDNSVGLYDLKRGFQISKIVGVPTSTTIFHISDNCSKLLYGNNQTVCLWSIATAEIEILTTQWRNVNCYAIRADGLQFVLGTYDGSLLVLTVLSPQRCTEMHLKRHKSCVMCVTYKGNEIVSVSYSKILLTVTISLATTGEKIVSYKENLLNDIPRSLNTCGDRVYLFYPQGFAWMEGSQMQRVIDGFYAVTNDSNNGTIVVKHDNAKLQFFELLEGSNC